MLTGMNHALNAISYVCSKHNSTWRLVMFALPWLSSLVLKCLPLSSPIGRVFQVIWTAGMWPRQSPRQPGTSIHISESQQRLRGVDFPRLYANNFCLASPCILKTSKNEYPTSPLGNLFWCFTTPGTKQSHPRWYKRFRNHQTTNWRSTENAQRVQLYSERSLSVYPSLRGGQSKAQRISARRLYCSR